MRAMSADFKTPELPAIGFLAEFPDEGRVALSSYGEFFPAHKDTHVIKEGTPQDSLYLVISGTLHVHTVANGRDTLLGRATEGDVIGEVSIFDPDVASATVTAVEFSQVWRIDRIMLEDFLNENPELGNLLMVKIATQLSRRLRATNEKVILAQKAIGDFVNWVY
jgi:CRP-like cAMP-binding protein